MACLHAHPAPPRSWLGTSTPLSLSRPGSLHSRSCTSSVRAQASPDSTPELASEPAELAEPAEPAAPAEPAVPAAGGLPGATVAPRAKATVRSAERCLWTAARSLSDHGVVGCDGRCLPVGSSVEAARGRPPWMMSVPCDGPKAGAQGKSGSNNRQGSTCYHASGPGK